MAHGIENYQEYLEESRQIMILDSIDDQLAGRVVRELSYLSTKNAKKPIELLISSPGGSVAAGYTIIDYIQHAIPNKVVGVGIGTQASMGAIIQIACDERKMLPHSKLMLHGLQFFHQGTVTIGKSRLKNAVRSEKSIVDLLREKTNITKLLKEEDIQKILDSEVWYSAEKCLEYGFCDAIITGDKEI